MSETISGSILVVDDEQDVAEGLEMNLSRHGYAAKSTTSVKQALQMIAKDRFASS